MSDEELLARVQRAEAEIGEVKRTMAYQYASLVRRVSAMELRVQGLNALGFMAMAALIKWLKGD